jgi:oligo-alginate lyase
MNRIQRTAFSLCGALVLVATSAGAFAARDHGGHYTAERLANARANCEKHEWAAKLRDGAVKRAAPWLARSDAELWAMVPGQGLPRTIDVTMDRNITKGPKRTGCLKCGDKIDKFGNYPYEPDFDKLPWKLTCPSCKVVFPTNDFGKYYASAIDEHGLFNPAKGDKSLLFNTEHPDPKDPLHKYGVDDGFGFVDETGRAHKFIGYYVWKHWGRVESGIAALADAYVYTGEKRYAHKAAVMLDRLADVYPAMDWKPYADRGWYHSDGNTDKGKIGGRIWETGSMTGYVDAYDKILSGTTEAPDLYAFLKGQSEMYKLPSPKGTRELLVKNIDDGVVRATVAGIHAGQILGNEGMHQRTMATCAVALDSEPESTQWLDWVFAPDGGALPGLIVGSLDRDGVSPEAGPGYALSWGTGFAEVANLVADYPKYTKQNLYRDFPQFRATFTAAYRLCALGVATPNIGDTGSTGSIGRAAVRPDFMADGFRYTQDPAMAVAAYRANNNSAAGLGRDVFAKDPDTLADQIERLGKEAGARPIESTLLSGYGLALLESGAGPGGTALSCYFGRSIFHGHLDHLNFDLLAFGKWLAPDHGYPEFATAWPHRSAVTINSIAHNLVLIDGQPQERDYGGKTRLFKRLPGLSVIQADAPGAYKQAKEYARTMLLIDAPGDNAYAVDVFHVTGGKDHVYSFHGPPGDIEATGVALVAQKEGSYAGADVPFKADKGPLGYSYFYNVRRDAKPAASFALDWTAQPGYRGTTEDEQTHLRFHSLSACDDLALADADPPQNKPGNPRRIGYALLHRAGNAELSSTFASLIEPYRAKPFIKSVERLKAAADSKVVAIRIELTDGTVDHLVVNPAGGSLKLSDSFSMSGKLALVRESGGKVARIALLDASELSYKDANVKAQPALAGKVVKMNRKLDGGGWIWIDAPAPTDGSLIGQHILISNDNARDAAYPIFSAEADGKLTKLYCGPISFVRGYAGPTGQVRGHPLPRDYGNGFLYDFEEGAAFRIPLHRVWSP